MFIRKNKQNEIPIKLDDVELILGREYGKLPIFLKSSFCPRCSILTTICDYTIFLDDYQHLIFKGSCLTCKGAITRYIETGWSTYSAGIAKHIRAIKALVSGS